VKKKENRRPVVKAPDWEQTNEGKKNGVTITCVSKETHPFAARREHNNRKTRPKKKKDNDEEGSRRAGKKEIQEESGGIGEIVGAFCRQNGKGLSLLCTPKK